VGRRATVAIPMQAVPCLEVSFSLRFASYTQEILIEKPYIYFLFSFSLFF